MGEKIYAANAATGKGLRCFKTDLAIRSVFTGIKKIKKFAHFYVHDALFCVHILCGNYKCVCLISLRYNHITVCDMKSMVSYLSRFEMPSVFSKVLRY